MRLTTARYFTPSGRSIQALGIEPDITVEQATLAEAEAAEPGRREADLRGALANPNEENGVSTETPADGSTAPALSDTPQPDYPPARAIAPPRGPARYNPRLRHSTKTPATRKPA